MARIPEDLERYGALGLGLTGLALVIPFQPLIGMTLIVLGAVLGIHVTVKKKLLRGVLWGALSVAIGLAVWFWQPTLIYQCASNTELRDSIALHQGQNGDHGRRKAIECLVMRDESLRGMILTNAWLDDGGRGLDGEDGQFQNAHLVRTKLANSDFSDAELEGAFFQGAELHHVDFRGAYLGSATLGARRYGLFRGTPSIEKPDLMGIKIDGETDLLEAWLHGLTQDDLPCDKLTRAKNWEKSYRDEDLACGKPAKTHLSLRN